MNCPSPDSQVNTCDLVLYDFRHLFTQHPLVEQSVNSEF